jgi:hypothetical protein
MVLRSARVFCHCSSQQSQVTPVEQFDCNSVGGQQWVAQADGSLLNPQSSLCLDDPRG